MWDPATFTSSKSAVETLENCVEYVPVETLEKGVKYVQSSGVFFIDFEHISDHISDHIVRNVFFV